ncbi:uncharacterized protein LOC131246479 isoform X3 [Magnolia sinica]|uniref:uncharacterized protein LOC131246479 isoform X3 n=1 Tax=Magnolia sinica TaxID=86752 RepID=UPI00265A7665|nr:uncharacterized protein LOC131246479 isoform X3 [Magnolia sinica]XP_058102633.1 uncharacterized protein LOC131246479 isoform X3 [Magnolia sinica]
MVLENVKKMVALKSLDLQINQSRKTLPPLRAPPSQHADLASLHGHLYKIPHDSLLERMGEVRTDQQMLEMFDYYKNGKRKLKVFVTFLEEESHDDEGDDESNEDSGASEGEEDDVVIGLAEEDDVADFDELIDLDSVHDSEDEDDSDDLYAEDEDAERHDFIDDEPNFYSKTKF